MTDISPIRHGATYSADEPAGTTPTTSYASDPFAELAALLVQSDFLRSNLDEQNLRAAREAERRAMDAEVDAMHRAADAIVVKAVVQGGLALVGGAAASAGSFGQIGNAPPGPGATADELCAFRRCNAELDGLAKSGGALGSLAQPLGELTGGVDQAHADANAREAAHAAEQASWRADDAQAHRERVQRHTDKVLDSVEATLETEHQGNFAILSNF